MLVLLAWRNIWRNKTRSLVIISSVALGLFAGLLVLSIFKGMMKGRIQTLVHQEVGHLQIHHKDFKKDLDPLFTIEHMDRWLKELHKNKWVKNFATRTITTAMLSTTTGSAGVQINGIIASQEISVSALDKKIIEGMVFHPNKNNEILIGRKLAKKMKLKLGHKLVLTLTDTASNLIAGAFRVAGIYQSENSVFDERNVYIKKEMLNEMLGIGAANHEISIILFNNDSCDLAKEQFKKIDTLALVETWKDISPETEMMNNTIDIYAVVLMMIILFALSFGIVNTMLMAILERTAEIGMMTALGMNKFRLFWMVLFETSILTLAGTPLGIGVSWFLIKHYERVGIDWSRMGKEMMSSFGFPTKIYPVFPTENFWTIVSIVLITAILSCIYPAIKALQLRPADALRK